MCGYGGGMVAYKLKFACFDCRKAFKYHWKGLTDDEQPQKCPDCGIPMVIMGMHFHVPKRKDKKQWEKVRILYENGFIYGACGCAGVGPGYRPAKLKEVPAFLETERHKRKSEGELLLEKTEKAITAR